MDWLSGIPVPTDPEIITDSIDNEIQIITSLGSEKSLEVARRRYRSYRTAYYESPIGTKSRYNFRVPLLDPNENIKQHLDRVFQRQATAFKINISGTVLLENSRTKASKFFHSSDNNSILFEDGPILITDANDMQELIESLDYSRIQESGTYNVSLSTEWRCIAVLGITIYIYHVINVPIGGFSDFFDTCKDDGGESDYDESDEDGISISASDNDFIDDQSDIFEGPEFYYGVDNGDVGVVLSDIEDEANDIASGFEDEASDIASTETKKKKENKKCSGYFKTADTRETPTSNTNLCIFTALAKFRNPEHKGRLVKQAQDLFVEWYEEIYPQHKVLVNKFLTYNVGFPGITPKLLPTFEKKFNVGVELYRKSLVQTVNGSKSFALLIRRSSLPTIQGRKTMKLYMSQNRRHVDLITDLAKFSSAFLCKICGQAFSRAWNCRRHSSQCTARTNIMYKGGPYSAPKTLFEKLKEFNIEVPTHLKFNRFRAVFDFESILAPVQKKNFVFRHIPMSVSVTSNVPGYEKPVTFVNKDPLQLVRDFLEYLTKISSKQGSMNYGDYGEIIDSLDSKIKQCEAEKNIKQSSRLKKLKRDLCSFIFQLCVVGFNSQSYDLVLIKPFFYAVLKEMDAFGDKKERRLRNMTYERHVAKGTNMLAFETDKLKFLDILNFCPPHVNYKKYLEAYGPKGGVEKYFFPYEKIDSFDCLLSTDFPDYDDFISTLKNENILESGKGYAHGLQNYKKMRFEWTGEEDGTKKFKDGKCLKDLLIKYNECDTVPFLEALEKQISIFRDLGIDIMADGYTLASCALKWCFRGAEGKFYTVPKEFAIVDTLLRKSITGGPAIVFRRHCAIGSKIREMEFGEVAELCRAIITWDCNAMYPGTFLEYSLGGCPILREGPDFLPQKVDTSTPGASYKSYEWLQYMSKKDGVDIRSAFNGGEVCLGDKAVPVDGWCRTTQTCYQFHGCLFHSCSTCKRGESDEWIKTSPEDRRKKTQETEEYIKSLGYDLKVIYECEWDKMREDSDVQALIKDVHPIVASSSNNDETENHTETVDCELGVGEKDILTQIENGQIFGFAQVSMHVPDNLKKKFHDLPPFFKTVQVDKSDLAPQMQEVCDRLKELKQPRRQLISSYFCEETLLLTEMIKWLLKKGCVCTRVYRVIQYSPVRCFGDKVLESAQLRREADTCPSKKPLGDAIKLCITSVYGKTAENKLKHTKTRIVPQDKIHRAIASNHFKDLTPIPNPDSFFRSNHANPRAAFRDSTDEIDGGEEFDEAENVEVEGQLYEVSSSQKKVYHDRPVQIAAAVYQYAKLKILTFVYDFIHYYCDYRKFMPLYMDTDSFCLGLNGKELEDIVLPSKKRDYFLNVHKFLPGESCEMCREQYADAKCKGLQWEGCKDCKEFYLFSQRTPNIFKVESRATEGVFLTSKTYCLYDSETEITKNSSKGIQKSNNLKLNAYKKVLEGTGDPGKAINKGFKKMKSGTVYSYEQEVAGLPFVYCKRKILSNGLDTEPLDL